MTWRVEWTLRNLNLTTLPPLTLPGLNGGPPGAVPELHPIAETIHLTVYHAVARELPPEGDYLVPRHLDRPDHLHHLERVTGRTVQIPDPEDPQPAVEVACEIRPALSLLTATTMTCIVTQAGLQ